jgi:hypothetical protein
LIFQKIAVKWGQCSLNRGCLHFNNIKNCYVQPTLQSRAYPFEYYNLLCWFLFYYLIAERICLPWEPQLTRILWWKVLDNVEASHVWHHRRFSSIEGARWSC